MSTDGRLDLDDLGEVIEHASSLDEVRSGADDERPTLAERVAATGVPAWLHRHRVPIAAVTAVVVVVGGFFWIRRDTRPPDDGLAHVAVVDSLSQSGIENPGPGMVSAIYTFVTQRGGDRIEVLGIEGPGIRASGVGAAVGDAHDAARSSVPVLATLGCRDPGALSASEDQYHFVVRRTDLYGRTVQADIPMPIGSQNHWALTVGGACLQQLATTSLRVEPIRAIPTQQPPSVRLELGVRSTLDRDVALDVLGYSGGLSVRPAATSVVVPAGGSAVLDVDELVKDCTAPAIDGVLLSSDGQTGYGVTNRTLDVYARIVTDSPDTSSAGLSLSWTPTEARQVTRAFAQACAGLPAHTVEIVSAVPAPKAAQDALLLSAGDPAARLVRVSFDVSAPVSAVTVADLIDPADLGDSRPSLVTIDVATGRPLGSATVPATIRAVDGRARVTVDWMVSCTGAYSPATAALQLVRDGRRWPVYLSFDDPVAAAGVLRVCPEVTRAQLYETGWASQRPSNG